MTNQASLFEKIRGSEEMWNRPRLQKFAGPVAAMLGGGIGALLPDILVSDDQFFVGLVVAVLGALAVALTVLTLFALAD